MNKTYKYTIAANSYEEVTFDTGVAQIAISNANGEDGGGTGAVYTAGDNIQISEENVISASVPVASANTLGGVKIGEGVNIDQNGVISVYKELTGTLTAGQTSLEITDASITTSSYFDIYTSVYAILPLTVEVITGKITLTFDEQTSDLSVVVRIT